MVRPSHRLDLLLVPATSPADGLGIELLSWLSRRGIAAEDGTAGSQALAWSREGFARIVLDKPGRTVLYSNGQGGFQVRCPVTGASVVSPFSQALTRARSGQGPWILSCSCGRDHPFGQLTFAPPVAFGSFAVITLDIGVPELTSEAMEKCRSLLGPLSVILRRG
jgi:hypothetical protein